jgi:hypothetical protein
MGDLEFLVGQTFDELRYSAPGNLRIVFDAGDRVEPALYADLGEFEFSDDAGERDEVDPEDPATVGPVLRAVGKQIQAVDTEGGTLSLLFSDGSRVRCGPHDDYEAWQVVGGSTHQLVVCMPGGAVAVWENTSREAPSE